MICTTCRALEVTELKESDERIRISFDVVCLCGSEICRGCISLVGCLRVFLCKPYKHTNKNSKGNPNANKKFLIHRFIKIPIITKDIVPHYLLYFFKMVFITSSSLQEWWLLWTEKEV